MDNTDRDMLVVAGVVAIGVRAWWVVALVLALVSRLVLVLVLLLVVMFGAVVAFVVAFVGVVAVVVLSLVLLVSDACSYQVGTALLCIERLKPSKPSPY